MDNSMIERDIEDKRYLYVVRILIYLEKKLFWLEERISTTDIVNIISIRVKFPIEITNNKWYLRKKYSRYN